MTAWVCNAARLKRRLARRRFQGKKNANAGCPGSMIRVFVCEARRSGRQTGRERVRRTLFSRQSDSGNACPDARATLSRTEEPVPNLITSSSSNPTVFTCAVRNAPSRSGSAQRQQRGEIPTYSEHQKIYRTNAFGTKRDLLAQLIYSHSLAESGCRGSSITIEPPEIRWTR